MLDHESIIQEMSLVRNRGLANAVELKQEVQRLADWREHVRAHPIPFVLASAVLTYALVPTRHSPPNRTGTVVVPDNGTGARVLTAPSSATTEASTAGLAGIGGAALGFAGSLLGNAIRGYIADQLQTLIHSRGNHAQNKR